MKTDSKELDGVYRANKHRLSLIKVPARKEFPDRCHVLTPELLEPLEKVLDNTMYLIDGGDCNHFRFLSR